MILLSWSFGCYSDNNDELPRFLKKTIVVKKGSYLQFKSVCEYYTDKRFLSHDIKQNWNSTKNGNQWLSLTVLLEPFYEPDARKMKWSSKRNEQISTMTMRGHLWNFPA